MAKISISSNSELNIVLRTIEGDLSAKEVIDSFEEIKTILVNGFNAVGIVTDLCKANFQFNPKEISKIASYLRENVSTFSTVKIAAVVNSPLLITIPLMVASQLTKISIKPFTTMEAAHRWILSYR